MPAVARSRPTILLWLLGGVFAVRVLGQALVAVGDAPFLPPMTEWQSGLLPYPVLLASQIMILGLQAWVAHDATRRQGLFAAPRPRWATRLRVVATLYAGAMAARYVLTMALHPDRRWMGGTIPIVFHWVLAGWLAAVAAAMDGPRR
jgi:hypothetical protein